MQGTALVSNIHCFLQKLWDSNRPWPENSPELIGVDTPRKSYLHPEADHMEQSAPEASAGDQCGDPTPHQ